MWIFLVFLFQCNIVIVGTARKQPQFTTASQPITLDLLSIATIP